MSLAARVGQFFFFLGFLALVYFFASNLAGSPEYPFICSGAGLLVVGGYMMWRFRNPYAPSERFRTLRKMREKRNKK